MENWEAWHHRLVGATPQGGAVAKESLAWGAGTYRQGQEQFLEGVMMALHVCRVMFGVNSEESACHAGDPSSIPGVGRSPGEGNGNPFQYSCLENSMNGVAWRATVHEVAKGWTQLSN